MGNRTVELEWIESFYKVIDVEYETHYGFKTLYYTANSANIFCEVVASEKSVLNSANF